MGYGGRPTLCSAEHCKRAEEAMRLGLTYELCAAYIGVGRSTFFNWLKKGKAQKSGIYVQFRDAVRRGEAQGAAMSLATIAQSARAGEWKAAAWLLERRHQYIRRTAVETTETTATDRASRIDLIRRNAERVGAMPARSEQEEE